MRKLILAVTPLVLALVSLAQAQTQTLGSTMEIYVFPKEGQDAAQQSKDEAACYEWAVGNTGSDPFKVAAATGATR